LEDAAPWVCSDCGQEVPAEELQWLNQSITHEIETMNKSGPEHLEMFLEKYQGMLHPTSSHILQVKLALVQIYGNANGYLIQGIFLTKNILYTLIFYSDLSAEQVVRKIELAVELLEVLSILEPGKSRTRSQMQLEMQPTKVFKAKGEYEGGKISQDEAKVKHILNL